MVCGRQGQEQLGAQFNVWVKSVDGSLVLVLCGCHEGITAWCLCCMVAMMAIIDMHCTTRVNNGVSAVTRSAGPHSSIPWCSRDTLLDSL